MIRPALRVEKRNYTVNPWRIVDENGRERWFEQVAFDHPHAGAMPLAVVGYRTKRDALAALDRYYESSSSSSSSSSVSFNAHHRQSR